MASLQHRLNQRLVRCGETFTQAVKDRDVASANLHRAVIAAYASGKSKTDIAKLAGVSRQTIHTILKEQQ